MRVLGGNYDTWQGSAVISGPLVADQLAFRIAGDLRTSRPSSDIADFSMAPARTRMITA